MADTLELFSRALDEFGARVKLIKEDRWSAPTPCADWDVRALVQHLVYECAWMAPLYEGQTVEEVGDRFEGDLLGTDPVGAWSVAARAASIAVSNPGALKMTVALSMGPTSGDDYARQVLTDLTIHAWDLARAIGAEEALDPELVADIAANPPYDVDGGRAAGYFGAEPPVAADADDQTKLLARFGRAV